MAQFYNKAEEQDCTEVQQMPHNQNPGKNSWPVADNVKGGRAVKQLFLHISNTIGLLPAWGNTVEIEASEAHLLEAQYFCLRSKARSGLAGLDHQLPGVNPILSSSM